MYLLWCLSWPYHYWAKLPINLIKHNLQSDQPCIQQENLGNKWKMIVQVAYLLPGNWQPKLWTFNKKWGILEPNLSPLGINFLSLLLFSLCFYPIQIPISFSTGFHELNSVVKPCKAHHNHNYLILYSKVDNLKQNSASQRLMASNIMLP